MTGVETRQVFDLPPMRLGVVEHRARAALLPLRGHHRRGLPAQARAAACYGPGLRALVCY